ncbi:hypothetical protein IJG12_00015 [Candidatus Saccharibacteria bacterium]|nr:hypothetical protein [Candidatus Saccharibacteria bacterium]
MKHRIMVGLVVVMVGLLFGAMNVSAVDGDGGVVMTISPPRQDIVLVPGEVYEGTLLVSNSANASKDLKYSATIGSFGLDKDENGNTDYNSTDVDTITEYNQIMEWMKLDKDHGSVAPNSTDTITFTITVPEDAPAGGQYATIIVQDDTEKDSGAEGNIVIENVVRFAASIIANVAGETRNEGAILENNIPAFMFNNKLAATSTVQNTGNVHTKASYVLQVWPLIGDEEICTNEEKPTEHTVMPGTERINAEECNLPMIGIFRVKQTVKIFGETSVAERMVVVCPLWLLFIIIFAIVALVIWLVTKSRSRKTRSKEQSKSSES